MKIESFNYLGLRNDEHFQYHTEFRDAVLKYGASVLKIEAYMGDYLILFGQEDEALKKIMKSALTADIQASDKQRDQLFRGMVDTNRAALNHFHPEVREAAKRLKTIFDTYGNLAQKPLNEETSGVYNLLQDLNEKYAPDMQKTGLTEWTNELQAANEAFSQLMKDRYEETALKTDLVMKQVRQKVDEQYRKIIVRINALIVVEGAENYSDFVRFVNAVVAKYNALLAQRAGRAKKS